MRLFLDRRPSGRPNGGISPRLRLQDLGAVDHVNSRGKERQHIVRDDDESCRDDLNNNFCLRKAMILSLMRRCRPGRRPSRGVGTKKARRASYCRWVVLEGSTNRWANVNRSLEGRPIAPGCYSNPETNIDAITDGGNPMNSGEIPAHEDEGAGIARSDGYSGRGARLSSLRITMAIAEIPEFQEIPSREQADLLAESAPVGIRASEREGRKSGPSRSGLRRSPASGIREDASPGRVPTPFRLR